MPLLPSKRIRMSKLRIRMILIHRTRPSIRIFTSIYRDIMHNNFPHSKQHRFTTHLGSASHHPRAVVTYPIPGLIHHSHVRVEIARFFELVRGRGFGIVLLALIPPSSRGTSRRSRTYGPATISVVLANGYYLDRDFFIKNCCFFGLHPCLSNIIINIQIGISMQPEIIM